MFRWSGRVLFQYAIYTLQRCCIIIQDYGHFVKRYRIYIQVGIIIYNFGFIVIG